jgi:SHR-binding domain of vacuolar-sorting associated protein 13
MRHEHNLQDVPFPTTMRFDISVHVALGKAPFSHTRIVTIAPTIVLVNASTMCIELCQPRCNVVRRLKGGESLPLQSFGTHDGKHEVMLRPMDESTAWCWSGRILIAEAGTCSIRIRAATEPYLYLVVPVTMTRQVWCLRVALPRAYHAKVPLLWAVNHDA